LSGKGGIALVGRENCPGVNCPEELSGGNVRSPDNRSFSVAITREWNSLLASVCQNTSVAHLGLNQN